MGYIEDILLPWVVASLGEGKLKPEAGCLEKSLYSVRRSLQIATYGGRGT